jgi:hypothetical protein
VGRFTQPDPLAGTLSMPMSQNRYSYVYNNPVMNTDPTGMSTHLSVSPGTVTQGGSVTISWSYDDIAHPTIVNIIHDGARVGGTSRGSAMSGPRGD